MAKENKTRYVLLGMLTLGPASGYDIKKQVRESLGHFWQVSYGQIYPMLKRLHADGLVTAEEQNHAERRSRRVYSITPKGRRAFRKWAEHHDTTAPLDKPEVLLKTFFGHQAPVESSISRLQDCQARSTEAMQLFASIDAYLAEEMADDPNLPYWRMTLRSGVLHNRATAQWCRESLAVLARLQKTPQMPGSPQADAEAEQQ